MNRFLSYFAFFLTVTGAIFTLLQSIYLIGLSLGLFPFTRHFPNPESFNINQMNVAFIKNMITLLLIISAIEIALFWLLVVLGIISRHQGIIASLILAILVGLISLFSFSMMLLIVRQGSVGINIIREEKISLIFESYALLTL